MIKVDGHYPSKAVTPSNKHQKHKSTQDRTNKRIRCWSAGLGYIWASRHINTYNHAPAEFHELDGEFAVLIHSRCCLGCCSPWFCTYAMWAWHSRGGRSSSAKSTPQSCYHEPQTFPEPILLYGRDEYPAESGPRHRGEASAWKVERGQGNNA